MLLRIFWKFDKLRPYVSIVLKIVCNLSVMFDKMAALKNEKRSYFCSMTGLTIYQRMRRDRCVRSHAQGMVRRCVFAS